LEHIAAAGKTYKTQFYSLDAIISVEYRVNSHKAAQFGFCVVRRNTINNNEKLDLTVTETRIA
jgi:hypothetical protein